MGPPSDYFMGSILPFQTTQVFSSYFGKITQLSGLLFVLALPLGTPGGQNREKIHQIKLFAQAHTYYFPWPKVGEPEISRHDSS